MKILVNGGLNPSVLDGWWAEAYAPEVGWAIGDGEQHGDDPKWDAIEAEQLYTVLAQEVIPKFYLRDSNGVAREWTAMIRESMARLTPQFSANRTVREYTEKYYLPAADAYRKREASQGAREIDRWRKAVAQHWSQVNFGSVQIETIGDFHHFRAQVYWANLSLTLSRSNCMRKPRTADLRLVSL
jgi:glycogen phosphorylase